MTDRDVLFGVFGGLLHSPREKGKSPTTTFLIYKETETVHRHSLDICTSYLLRNMPSMLYRGGGAPHWPKDYPRLPNNLFGVYLLPPIKYPDGKFYIKSGNLHGPDSPQVSTVAEVKVWFCTEGVTPLATKLASMVTAITKGIQTLSYHGDHCIVADTPTRYPYIDLVHPDLGVAIGGNSISAKSSDEIGRIAAMLVLYRKWDSELPAEAFKLKLKDTSKSKL